MKEVIAVFIYVYPDLISLDLSRKVLKCYGMAAMCEYTISNKIYNISTFMPSCLMFSWTFLYLMNIF